MTLARSLAAVSGIALIFGATAPGFADVITKTVKTSSAHGHECRTVRVVDRNYNGARVVVRKVCD